MSYTISEKGEITIEGWEKGIATSPHKGIANIQAGNISTEPGEVMANFSRVQQSQVNAAGTTTITAIDASHFGSSMFVVSKGVWVTISGSSNVGELANGTYWTTITSGLQLSATYGGSPVGGITPGLTATLTLIRNLGKPIAKATEPYSDGTKMQYRYYVLDNTGLVWAYDTLNDDLGFPGVWFLPETTLYTNATGLAVLNGWLMMFANSTSPTTNRTIWCKPTFNLSIAYSSFAAGVLQTPASSPNKNYAFVGHQGKLYYTDTNFIGSIFPNTSLLSGAANIQSYCKYTAVTDTGTISTLISGSLPTVATASIRIPAFFLTDGTKPTAITLSTQYYLEYSAGGGTFQAFAAASGGAAIDLQTGASGNQYFNTFQPTNASGKNTYTWTPQRLNLPFYEVAQCIGELGNTVVIGCASNVLYPWNQVDVLPGDLVPLPENNAVNMITVNNMLYVFAGNKGNIYVTNGSTASLALTVPDYCAGIAGTPQSYVDPYFTWGDAMYLRGRVWFSILDQVAAVGGLFQAKAGNCGGIWSFVPTQNFFYGQDTGLALRLENQNSYNSYNGYCSVLIPAQNQTGRGPQYWSGWQSGLSSITYGIDFTNTGLQTNCVIETDLIPTGTLLQKKTFSQIEYKLGAPLYSTESVSIKYRQNATDAWTTCGTAVVENTGDLSGYFPIVFEKGQWLQLQISLIPGTVQISANVSFIRLKKVIVR